MIFLLNIILKKAKFSEDTLGMGVRLDLGRTWAELLRFLCSIDVQYGKCDSLYFTSTVIFLEINVDEDRRRIFERQIVGQWRSYSRLQFYEISRQIRTCLTNWFLWDRRHESFDFKIVDFWLWYKVNLIIHLI